VTTLESTAGDWIGVDIGSPGAAGTHAIDAGTFTVEGSGADIWGSADSLYMVYKLVDGDAEIIAKLESMDNTDAWAKSGVMIRDTTAAGSKEASCLMTPTYSSGARFQYRTSDDGGTAGIEGGDGTAPYWVRVVRSGSSFTGYRSADGSTWTEVSSQSISMTATVLVGLAVCSHNDGVLNTSVFSNVSLTGDVVGDPGDGDADNDGIPDDWEELYAPGNPGTMDETTDSDGDGILDIDEYVMDTNPTVSNDPPMIDNTVVMTNGSGYVLQWNQASPNRNYTVMWSTNLEAEAYQELTEIQGGNSFTDTLNTSQQKIFYKLRIRP
jgi:regulation of enolase protein 1 (concanavalin A-like superfamily)